ncbi:hypothetical protein CBR_g21295 [Chara braunii]|uniref:Myb-like domain-containing protein n=1 Tax=Chara braunii TaxID=69332 RepID=A0A388L178_CHABU|nr:hypothetical protein CBR_g21295 [Chara braunii]|eukprot:GBG76055.1 hypothetical protein CBR_g21295 [Chara braunii]
MGSWDRNGKTLRPVLQVGDSDIVKNGRSFTRSVDGHPHWPWVLFAAGKNLVQVWNYEDGTRLASWLVPDCSQIPTVKFIPQEGWILVQRDNKGFEVFEFRGWKLRLVKSIDGGGYVSSEQVAVHPALSYLLTVCNKKRVVVWDWGREWKATDFEHHSETVGVVAFRNDPLEWYTFASASADGRIKVCDFRWNDVKQTIEHTCIPSVCRMSFCDYSQRSLLITGDDKCCVRIWDYKAGVCVAELTGHKRWVTSAFSHPYAPYIFSACWDGQIMVWSKSNYRRVLSYSSELEGVISMAPCRDSQRVVVGGRGGFMVLELGEEARAAPVGDREDEAVVLLRKKIAKMEKRAVDSQLQFEKRIEQAVSNVKREREKALAEVRAAYEEREEVQTEKVGQLEDDVERLTSEKGEAVDRLLVAALEVRELKLSVQREVDERQAADECRAHVAEALEEVASEKRQLAEELERSRQRNEKLEDALEAATARQALRAEESEKALDELRAACQEREGAGAEKISQLDAEVSRLASEKGEAVERFLEAELQVGELKLSLQREVEQRQASDESCTRQAETLRQVEAEKAAAQVAEVELRVKELESSLKKEVEERQASEKSHAQISEALHELELERMELVAEKLEKVKQRTQTSEQLEQALEEVMTVQRMQRMQRMLQEAVELLAERRLVDWVREVKSSSEKEVDKCRALHESLAELRDALRQVALERDELADKFQKAKKRSERLERALGEAQLTSQQVLLQESGASIREGAAFRKGRLFREYSWKELQDATENFGDCWKCSDEEDPYGCSYLAKVYNQITVNRFRASDLVTNPPPMDSGGSGSSSSSSFKTKVVDRLRFLEHPHLVKFLGVCYHDDNPNAEERCLVYEHMSNGSVKQWIASCGDRSAGRRFLPWHIRLRVLAQVAQALHFLHSCRSGSCGGPLIHRAIRPANILLDERLGAKVRGVDGALLGEDTAGNFTRAFLASNSQYIAPEYWRSGFLDEKTDRHHDSGDANWEILKCPASLSSSMVQVTGHRSKVLFFAISRHPALQARCACVVGRHRHRQTGGEACEGDDDGDDEGDGVNIAVQTIDNARGDVDSTQYSNQGQTLVGREGGRPHDKRKGKDNAATNKKQNVPWTLEERTTLAKLMEEGDAVMADAEGQHQFMKMKERYAWVHDRMKDNGFRHRTAEDCRKKWTNMLSKVKLILDRWENVTGMPSYFDLPVEKRKELEVPLAFERPLWEAMQWKLNRPSISCDKTLVSEDLTDGGGETAQNDGPWNRGSGRSGSDGRTTDDSDGPSKRQRSNSGKARVEDTSCGGSSLGRVMEDSTRAYRDGLDKVASTLAKATSEVGTTITRKIGDVADAMRGGNTVLEMLVGVLARRGGGGRYGADEGRNADPSSR